MVTGLTDLFDQYEDVVYTSGHEHNLQYQPHGTAHYVVSGSGSKSSYLRGNTKLAYGTDQKGFSVLKSYENGDLWLEFFVPEMQEINGGLTFRKKIRSGNRTLEIPEKATLKLSRKDSTVTVVPGGKYYEGGKLKNIIMGELYRDVWQAPIDVPIIDISKEHGGLVPTTRGGGMQSKSLRLEAPDGKEYVLRSVQKFPAGILPNELRKTFVSEIIQDVIAASHPYASVVLPTLSDAAGVYHTNPKLVYVPDDPALGQYRPEFGNLLCLYEERPDDDQSDMASFGYSKDVESSSKMHEEIRENYKDRVDENVMLRARLFDLLIGDWDRHDDQWRWASFEEGDKTIYKPIPRDRDQVFYSVNGLIPKIVNRKWLQRRFQPFEDDIRDMAGMNFNGQYVDRAYLSELEWSAWDAMCDTLQRRMTDQLFKDALAHFPDTAYALDGERIYKTLQIHREKLKDFAREYYLILAKEVDVVGSYKEEYFEIIRLDDMHTEVNVYPKKKKNKKDDGNRIYHRVFLTSETKEIRIYGLDGEDVYVVTGNVNKGPIVRLIGGSETDKYINESNVKGWKNKLQIYDTREKKKKKRNKTELGKDARIQLTEDDDFVVEYDRKGFQYDWLAPVVDIGYNPDDGLFFGGGVHFKKNACRRLYQ